MVFQFFLLFGLGASASTRGGGTGSALGITGTASGAISSGELILVDRRAPVADIGRGFGIVGVSIMPFFLSFEGLVFDDALRF